MPFAARCLLASMVAIAAGACADPLDAEDTETDRGSSSSSQGEGSTMGGTGESTGSDSSSSSGSADETATSESSGGPTNCSPGGIDDDELCGEGEHCEDEECVPDLGQWAECDEDSDCATDACIAGVCAAPKFSRLSAYMGASALLSADGSINTWGRANDLDSGPLPSTVIHIDDACALDDLGNAWCDVLGLDVVSPTPMTHVSRGCGVTTAGQMQCWGSFAGLLEPPAGDDFVIASTRRFSTCGLSRDGTVECESALGFPPIPDLPGTFVDLALGSGSSNFVCGLRLDQEIECAADDPDQEPPAGPFSRVTAGDDHACGLLDDGTIECWRPTIGPPNPLLDLVVTPPPGSFEDIAAGPDHTCATASDGHVECWGLDTYGQSTAPTSGVLRVSPRSDGTRLCSVLPDESLQCFGTDDPTFPFDVYPLPPTGSFAEVGYAGRTGCAIRTDGTGVCWDSPIAGELGPVDSVCSGEARSDDGIGANGAYACWVATGSEQITCQGTGLTWFDDAPAGPAQSVGCGDGYACALMADDTVQCWGSMFYTPQAPAGSFSTISCNSSNCCGVHSSGDVACWYALSTKLGGGWQSHPGDYVDVCTNDGPFGFLCARTPTNEVECWDDGFFPEVVAGSPAGTFQGLWCGHDSACAVADDGGLVCWGGIERRPL